MGEFLAVVFLVGTVVVVVWAFATRDARGRPYSVSRSGDSSDLLPSPPPPGIPKGVRPVEYQKHDRAARAATAAAAGDHAQAIQLYHGAVSKAHDDYVMLGSRTKPGDDEAFLDEFASYVDRLVDEGFDFGSPDILDHARSMLAQIGHKTPHPYDTASERLRAARRRNWPSR